MNQTTTTIIAVLGLILIAALVWTRQPDTPTTPDPEPTPNHNDTVETVDATSYQSAAYGLSFSYPDTYFLTETGAGVAADPEHIIVLAEDTAENRDLFAGRVTTPRDGPPTITIEIHDNDDELSPSEWLEQSSLWDLGQQQTTSATVSGHAGVAYTWSGLYEGESVVIAVNEYIYVFSVSALNTADPIVSDFHTLLSSVRIN